MHTAPHKFCLTRLLLALCAATVFLCSPATTHSYFSATAQGEITWITADWKAPVVAFQVSRDEHVVPLVESVDSVFTAWNTSHTVQINSLSSIESTQVFQSEQQLSEDSYTRWLYLEMEFQRENFQYVAPVLRITHDNEVLLERLIPNQEFQVGKWLLPIPLTFDQLLESQIIRIELDSNQFSQSGFTSRILYASTRAAPLNSDSHSILVHVQDVSESTLTCLDSQNEVVQLAQVSHGTTQLLNLPEGVTQIICQASDHFGNQSPQLLLSLNNSHSVASSSLPFRVIGEGDAEWLALFHTPALSDPWVKHTYSFVPFGVDPVLLEPVVFLPPSTQSHSTIFFDTEPLVELLGTHESSLAFVVLSIQTIPEGEQFITSGELHIHSYDAAGDTQLTVFSL